MAESPAMANTITASKATIAIRGKALRKMMAASTALNGLWSGGESEAESTLESDCELLVEVEPESDCESLVEVEPESDCELVTESALESDCELLVEAAPESEGAFPTEPDSELLAARPQAALANSANKARQIRIRV